MTTADELPWDVESLRGDFPILASEIYGGVPLTYLDNAATTQRPRQVIEAMTTAYERQYANVHRGLHYLSELSTDLYENARDTVQRFLNARRVHEVIFTAGTTASINLVARSWGDANLRAGDEILLTEMEHHSNIVPWQQLACRTGCRVRFLPVTDGGQLVLDALDDFLTERTKLVSVVAVSNVLGTINPVSTIVRRAHQAGALVLVDAAQSVPHGTTDVQAWDADFVAFSGHKMLGPSGIGVLYGRETILESMPPFLGGGSMILPTAHFDGPWLYLLYPPDRLTEEATLREGRLCQREGITINLFLVPSWSQSEEDIRFAYRLAESTKGRVFFTAGCDLDRCVVWDYVRQKREILA